MGDDIFGFGFRYLGVKEGRAAPFRKPFTTGTTAQQAHTIVAIHFTNNEIVWATLTKLLAFGIDTS
jgi:hypothetical protein